MRGLRGRDVVAGVALGFALGIGCLPGEAQLAEGVPEAEWIQEDPANDLYREARTALREREYQRAAELFASLRERYRASGYVADSYYYEAYARQRMGEEQELRMALELLAAQEQRHAAAATRQDAEALRVRVESQLARRGDRESYERVEAQAAQGCGEQDEVRMAALSALLNMDPDRARPILIEVLESRDACSVELRKQAVFLLGQSMDEGNVDVMLDLIYDNPDPDPEVRGAAVFWLGQSGSPRATEALNRMLQETDDRELQEAALYALARVDGPGTMDILVEYARRTDIDPELRANAVFWIAQRPGPESSRVLRELYPSAERELKEQIIFGLSRHEEQENVQFLRDLARRKAEDAELRMNALHWLAQSGAGLPMGDLVALYRSSEDRELKQQIIFVAAQQDDEEVVTFLIEVANDEGDRELREQAIHWLGRSEDPRAAEALMEIIRR
jgi:HEAT repeat protein